MVHRHLQLLRGKREQSEPCFGGGSPNPRSAPHNCGACDGSTLIRRGVRLDPDRLDLRHIQVEFLGSELQQRSGSALAEFDEAHENCRGVIGVDR